MIASAKRRSEESGVPFSITSDDVSIPKKCPILGIPLIDSTGTGKRNANTPSLDRIVPKRGYVKNNVVVISWRANELKRDASLNELRLMWKFYARYFKKGKH